MDPAVQGPQPIITMFLHLTDSFTLRYFDHVVHTHQGAYCTAPHSASGLLVGRTQLGGDALHGEATPRHYRVCIGKVSVLHLEYYGMCIRKVSVLNLEYYMMCIGKVSVLHLEYYRMCIGKVSVSSEGPSSTCWKGGLGGGRGAGGRQGGGFRGGKRAGGWGAGGKQEKVLHPCTLTA